MEKTIRCPECGDDVVPEEKMCPVCSYQFEMIDFLDSDLTEEELDGRKGEIKINPALLGKVKVIGFILVLFLVVFFFFNR